MKIGIVGMGTLGSTIFKIMSVFYEDVQSYDLDQKKCTSRLFKNILDSNVIFICLPTPVNERGRLDSTFITQYLEILKNNSYKGLIVIKSTLPLGFFKTARKCKLRILYSPEFLHENKALAEFLDPKFVVCSGSEEDFIEYINVLYWVPTNRFSKVGDRTAEISKLAMNAFAATKISFVNEVERICKLNGADIEMVMEFLRKDGRCAPEYSHPNRGPYGGKCLEKDTSELRHCTPNTFLLEGVIKTNERTKREQK